MTYDSRRRDEFECVALPHCESLLRTALRITSNRAEAEDLVQEALLRAWRAFDQFERDSNCKAWLFRIMLNISNKTFRQSRRVPILVSLDEEAHGNVIPLQVTRPRQLTSVEVLSALDALSLEHRMVLILAVVEGFTSREISGICSVPIGTVMSRLSRGRAELRRIFLGSERKERQQRQAASSRD